MTQYFETEQQKIDYTQQNIDLIYSLDPKGVHVIKDDEGNLVIKKQLSYPIGKYPSEFTCETCGKQISLEYSHYNPYSNTHICDTCFYKDRDKNYINYIKENRTWSNI